MTRQTITAVTPEECELILAQISSLVNRLQLGNGDNRRGTGPADAAESADSADDNDNDNDNDVRVSISRPPTPPPSASGSTSCPPLAPTYHTVAHDHIGSVRVGSSGGSTISVHASGPTVIPILPNAHALKVSAHDSAVLTGSYAYDSEYFEPWDAKSSAPVAVAPAATGPWYSVVRGKAVGVFAMWETVSPLVTGVSGAIYRRHSSRQAAEQAFETALQAGNVAVIF
ncbi:hypothetical protein PUNSTDRAFT_134414 [Punctularia strigosozonata HHB-11173 SS5]|uniref:uncharacterized protein n=1 Tax=Punctularia strigosozonata (strain HHB-11173) TaxID=741275 RepID=UPI00044170C5|nr:uncharacterized protein PUNSTDRAFT_134414 [Punctularia strigosozonata HHB-11173 SS5]EIN09251.1 hypothetical protein PUNSTDRAFT_134414 [Punctularia strigosozonata HHB-11173 SS5]